MRFIFLVLGIIFLQTVLAYSGIENNLDNRVDSDEKYLSPSGLKYRIPKNFRLRTPGNFQVRISHKFYIKNYI